VAYRHRCARDAFRPRLRLATLFTLLLTPVAYRILAPLSKPRAAETQKLIDELQAARAR
jgi:hypothetical protein